MLRLFQRRDRNPESGRNCLNLLISKKRVERPLWMYWKLGFSSLFLLSFDQPVVPGVGNRRTRRKPLFNPKLLETC